MHMIVITISSAQLSKFNNHDDDDDDDDDDDAGVYLFFLYLLQNIDCGYSLEPPHVYLQSMF